VRHSRGKEFLLAAALMQHRAKADFGCLLYRLRGCTGVATSVEGFHNCLQKALLHRRAALDVTTAGRLLQLT
jgi:hypothetical protein